MVTPGSILLRHRVTFYGDTAYQALYYVNTVRVNRHSELFIGQRTLTVTSFTKNVTHLCNILVFISSLIFCKSHNLKKGMPFRHYISLGAFVTYCDPILVFL